MTTLNPDSKAYFDPDFDVVDDMKFIDSLIRTMPEADQQQPHSSEQIVQEVCRVELLGGHNLPEADQQQPHSSEQLVNSYQTSSNKRYAGS